MVKKTKFAMLMCIAVFLAALVCAGAASAYEQPQEVTGYKVSQFYDYSTKQIVSKVVEGKSYLIENESNWRYVLDSVNGDDYDSSPYVNANLVLVDDIVFTSEVESLGTKVVVDTPCPFLGTIYGNGHKFVNFTQSGPLAVGLIGIASNGCVLNYVQMTDSKIASSSIFSVGGLVGNVVATSGVRLDGCSVTRSNITSTGSSSRNVGGLVGMGWSSLGDIWINASWVDSVYVSGSGYVGGLVGYAESGIHIEDSWVNCSEIYSGSIGVGGLVGRANNDFPITNATVRGCKIWSGSDYVGGLVGVIDSVKISGCVVEHCTIEGINNVSGLVGAVFNADNVQLVESLTWVNYSWVNGTEYVGSLVGSADTGTFSKFDLGNHSNVYSSNSSTGWNGFDPYNNKNFNDAVEGKAVSPIGITLFPGINFGYRNNLYAVQIANAEHGTATVSEIMNVAGTPVQLYAYPDSGYRLDYWNISGLGNITGNTFMMPSKSVTVTPHFVEFSEDDYHFAAEYNFTDLGGSTNVKAYYDEIRKTVFVEKANPSGANPVLGNIVLNVTQFGLKDSDVQLIEVDYDVSLASAPNAFKLFTNAGFNYLGESLPNGFTIGGIPVYMINATNSSVYIEAKNSYTGKAITVDSGYAVPGQSVNLAVKPLQNYSVYGWSVYEASSIDSSKLRADSDSLVKLSIDEEGNILYVLTMPADFSGTAVTVSPKLRDQGSTFVTYVFLDADTYVMEIPADFSLTGINKTVSGKEVNITACDLLEGHNLKVTMNSTNGLNNAGLFQMLSVKDRSAAATYTIGEKDVYKGALIYSPVTINGKTVLYTKDIPSTTSVEELIAEGNLKTDLQFTLKQMLKPDVIGKYKDKLTFTVEITTA